MHFLCFIKLRDTKSEYIDLLCICRNESEMRVFAKLVAKVETAPRTNTAPTPLAFIQHELSYFVAAGAPNNHAIAMVIAL